jgi:hypothetical protein
MMKRPKALMLAVATMFVPCPTVISTPCSGRPFVVSVTSPATSALNINAARGWKTRSVSGLSATPRVDRDGRWPRARDHSLAAPVGGIGMSKAVFRHDRHFTLADPNPPRKLLAQLDEMRWIKMELALRSQSQIKRA